MKKKLFALLIGINDYKEDILVGNDEVYFPRLSGCVNDAKKIEKMLGSDNSLELNIVTLFDKAATKKNIVEAIKSHLGQAGENDVAVLYFSGHGAQEKASNGVFSTESDGKLESIACYYEESTRHDFLLADKELRWLVEGLSRKKPHILTIFDCCHSGDNLRAVDLLEHSFPKVVEKRTPYVFPEREWKHFLFSDKITKEQFISEGIHKLLPEGSFFHFSACESNEAAVEIGGEGVFTKTLVRVLETSGGSLTYQSLFNRVRQYMRNVYVQKPKFYIGNGSKADLFKPFLDKDYKDMNALFGEVVYNQSSGWKLNLGALQGIGKNIQSLELFDPADSSKKIKATIKAIQLDTADVLPEVELDITKVYRTNIEGISSGKIKLHFDTTGAIPADQEIILNAILNESGDVFVAEDDENNAQYTLRFRNGDYYLTLPGDIYRPLAAPVSYTNTNIAREIKSDLKQIADWEFLKNLVNEDPQTKLTEETLKVEIALGLPPADYRPVNGGDKVAINLIKENEEWHNKFRIRITNTSKKPVYCACIYLLSDYACTTRLLTPSVAFLEPGNSVDILNGEEKDISIGLNDIMKWYNWPAQSDFLQFVGSTEPFEVDMLNFEKLPSPPFPGLEEEKDKHLMLAEPKAQVNGWFTKRLELEFISPVYNTAKEDELELMLKDPETTDFALGLYFDADTSNLSTSYQLKKDIQVIKGKFAIRDTIIDIANWWSRKKRNRHFKKAMERFPDRVTIVSEGDSWFQHPLVLDIIDHLHRTYNIYCVSAAGDTLSNYLSREKKNGEYYLDAIQEINPAFFLISGGGNDILGSQFRNFLKDNPDNTDVEGNNPEKFLHQEIFHTIKSLMDIYETTFFHLETDYPMLHIVVHGYDYPAKLNEAKKGWLGRYMIEKGISRPGDRKAIMHFIMDRFNDELAKVCSKFRHTVTYIDVRNIVRYNEEEKVDQWYDEIHPTNEGFQQIAMKFIRSIDETVKKKKATPPPPPASITTPAFIQP